MAGQLVACTVTASDGKSGTDTDTGSVTIGNTAPVVSSVTLSPGTVYTNDTLTATPVSSDADGDSLTLVYDWYVDGALAQSGASATLSGVTRFSRGQVVYVTVTADDGTDTGSSTSSSVTVSNTAPTAPVANLSPSAPVACDEDLVCTLASSSTDPDGDPIAYLASWTIDGTPFAGASTSSITSDTVSRYDTADGDVWTCIISATDGVGSTPSAAATASLGSPSMAFAGRWEVESNVCGDGREWLDSSGLTGEAGYVELEAWSCSAELVLQEGLDSTCSTAVSTESPTPGWGMTRRGQVHVGSGSGTCPGGWGGTSSSGATMSTGWMSLYSTGNVLFAIVSDDCGSTYEGCPVGYTVAGRTHVGGGCSDTLPNAVGYTGASITAGWLGLCVADGSATLTGTETCP
jgi:hypothetical protein